MRIKVLLCSLAMLLFFAGEALAQGKTVKGRVFSGEDREPLIGANVIVKGTEKGAATDIDGVYVLEDVNEGDVLVVVYIGYQGQETTVGSDDVVDFRLIPVAISGDEEVVIGYGTQQAKDLTNAVATLDEHAFNKGVTTDFQQLLQSRVPGVTVSASSGDLGAEPLIRIRGGTSISAGNGPMIVIDGVPVDNAAATPNFDETSDDTGGDAGTDSPSGGTRENPLSSLNPNDIESINILKDASAAAIYGARGGNGVILITTKSGSGGAPSLTYDVYTSTSTQSKTYDLLSASEYRDYAGSAPVTAYLNANGLSLGNLDDSDTDWQDEVNRAAFGQSHNLSFSSGGDRTSYLLSVNYLDEEGIIVGSDRQRITGRLNVKHKVLDDKLTFNLRFNPSFIKRNNTPYRQAGGFRGGLFTNVLKYNPTLPALNADGSFYEFPGSPDIRNPVAMVELIEDQSENLRIFANLTADYQITPSLSGKINLGMDRSDAERAIYQPNSLPYAASFGGRADLRTTDRQNVLLETTFNYNANISDNQKLEAWAGYSFQEFENIFRGSAAQGFVTDAWSFDNLSGGSDFSVRPFSFATENRLISFLGRAVYSISDKYLLNAAVRREGSSRFGSESQWGVFPSLSAGWRLSEESFLNSSSLIDDLKLRVSYGITGNQDIGDYLAFNLLGPGANAVIGDQILTGVSATQVANPDLQWEETSQVNVGVDFALKGNRISGSVDLYQKNTDNLLLGIPIPQPSVVETRITNIGEVENRGIEFSLNTINISNAKFFWRSNFNIAANRNEVLTMRSDEDFIIHGRLSGAGLSSVDAQIIKPGLALGTFIGPRFLGYDANGKEILSTDPSRPESSQGILGDGRFILGDAQPDFTYGFSSTMVYGNFDLRFFFQGVQGIELLNNTRLEYQRPSNILNGLNMFAETVDDVNAGLGVNEVVAYSDRFIEDASYLRLQNMTLGYTFDSAFFRNLRVYLSADNLFVLTGYKGLDPEVNTFAIRNADEPPTLGIDYTNYPRARTFTIGLNLGLR